MRAILVALLLCACGGNDPGGGVSALQVLQGFCGTNPCPGAALIDVTPSVPSFQNQPFVPGSVVCHCGGGVVSAGYPLDATGCAALESACH